MLKPEIFGILQKIEPGKGGEIQLTDALEVLADNEAIAGPVLGVIFRVHGAADDLGRRIPSDPRVSRSRDISAELHE